MLHASRIVICVHTGSFSSPVTWLSTYRLASVIADVSAADPDLSIALSCYRLLIGSLSDTHGVSTLANQYCLSVPTPLARG